MRNRILFLMLIVFISFITNKEINAQVFNNCNDLTVNCTIDSKGWQTATKQFKYGDCQLGVVINYAKCTNGKYIINASNIFALNPNNVACAYPGFSYVYEIIRYLLISSPDIFNMSDYENIHYVTIRTPSCGKMVFHPGTPSYTRFETSGCTPWCCETEYGVTSRYGGVRIESNIFNKDDQFNACSGPQCESYCTAHHIAPDNIDWSEFSTSGTCDLACFWRLDGNKVSDFSFLGTTNDKPLIIKANNVEAMRILSNGNVGIGTTTPPTAKLEVNGSLKATTLNTTGNIVLASGAKVGIGVAIPTVSLDVSGAVNTTGNIVLATGARVGIGVASPTVSLDVSGAVKATGNIVLATGARIGIGVASPAVSLDVSGAVNTTGNIILATGAKVGIGVAIPTATLDIKTTGSAGLFSALNIQNSGSSQIFEVKDNGDVYINGTISTFSSAPVKMAKLYVGIGNYDPAYNFQTVGNAQIIGTTDITSNLKVHGIIYTTEVLITDPASWPDFVFDKNYKLSSLSEISSYIKQYGHLPDVPSKESVEKNGIKLVEMQTILLKKVEELTLHLIELEKKNDVLKEEIDNLKNTNK